MARSRALVEKLVVAELFRSWVHVLRAVSAPNRSRFWVSQFPPHRRHTALPADSPLLEPGHSGTPARCVGVLLLLQSGTPARCVGVLLLLHSGTPARCVGVLLLLHSGTPSRCVGVLLLLHSGTPLQPYGDSFTLLEHCAMMTYGGVEVYG
jgi:hypothetical protein